MKSEPKMKKVMVFGTFDGLHSGHLSLFKQTKSYGDYLIVVVARDKTVKKIKNRLPKKNEAERLKELLQCQLVNEARLGYEDNPYRIIREIKPDVICLGYDQKAFTEDLPEKLKKMKLATKIYRMKPYQPEKYHSLIARAKRRAGDERSSSTIRAPAKGGDERSSSTINSQKCLILNL